MPGRTRTATPTPQIEKVQPFWSNLSVEDAPAITTQRVSSLEGTPFVQWVTTAQQTPDSAKRLQPMSGENAATAITMLRLAAKQVGTGIKFKVTDSKGSKVKDIGTAKSDVTVSFQAKEKRAYSAPKRTQCPVCHKDVMVSKDGKVSTHGPRDARCTGSKQAASV